MAAKKTALDVKRVEFNRMIKSDAMRVAMERALPKHVDLQRMASAVMTAVSQSPKLLQCTPISQMRAIALSCQLGLEPGGALGSAYLVPYGDTCQLIVGYRGLIDLAKRSGKVRSVTAHVVYHGDRFEESLGSDEKIIHVPKRPRDEDAEVEIVYCVITLDDGTQQHEVMERRDVEKIRACSRAANSGPWVDHWNEMARKTVVKRALKYAPLTTELATAVEADERADRGADVDDLIIDGDFLGIGPEPEPVDRADAITAELEEAEGKRRRKGSRSAGNGPQGADVPAPATNPPGDPSDAQGAASGQQSIPG